MTSAPLSGATALIVTGAGGGIGSELVRIAVANGLTIVAVVQDEEEAGALRARLGAGAEIIVADFASEEQTALAAERVEDAVKSLKVVGFVHCAGIAPVSALADIPLEEVDRALRINVLSAYVLIQSLLPTLRRDSARIVVLGLNNRGNPRPLLGAYAIATEVLYGMVDVLRYEVWRTGIKVSIVECNPVSTSMARNIAGRLLRIVDTTGLAPEFIKKIAVENQKWNQASQVNQFAKRLLRVIEGSGNKFRYLF